MSVERGATTGDGRNDGPAEGTFEERLARLAELVGKLEGGQLGLSASIDAYERGVALVNALHAELLDVEQRVKILTAGTSTDGSAVVSTAEERAADGADAVRRRAVPRAAKASSKGTEPTKSASPPPSHPRDGKSRRLPGMDDANAEA